MTSGNWLKSRSPQNLVLWALAVVFFGLALANVPLLGIEPEMLPVLAAVFASTAGAYRRNADCNAT